MKWPILFVLGFAQSAFSGGAVGNGGDAVICKPSDQNKFVGYYALDYLVKFSESLQPVSVSSLSESLDRIQNELSKKLPELAESFREYRSNLFNVNDFSKKHIWEEAPFGLVDLKDESMVELLPVNCREGDKTSVVQAVIRQPPTVAGLPEYKIKYKFTRKVVDELQAQNAVQLSFLLVHEWLWDFSKNVERNRKINYWIHTTALTDWTREMWTSNLEGVGFTFPGSQIPVWEESVCQPDLNTLNFLKGSYTSVTPAKGKLFQRVTNCDWNECSFHEDSELFRKAFNQEVFLTFDFSGWVSVRAPGQEAKIDCLYDEVTGKMKECRYRDFDDSGHLNFFLDLNLVFGADCVTLRGYHLNWSSNIFEEYVFYFGGIQF